MRHCAYALATETLKSVHAEAAARLLNGVALNTALWVAVSAKPRWEYSLP
ncbi:hypothetical protein [Aquisalimonas lutea]